MAEVKQEAPKGAAFTLRIPLDRDRSQFATYHIKEIDEAVYLAARSFFDKDKDFDAVKLMIKSLMVQPSDDISLIEGNFVALRSAVQMFAKLIAPVEGELKKN
jgi:hypothetical protein